MISFTVSVFGQLPKEDRSTLGPQTATAAAGELTPESLGMPRSQIVFNDRMLRLFNGRGSVSVRDRSVTGLHHILFPPIAPAKFGLVRDYQFQLAFREAASGVLIQDVVQDAYEHMVSTGEGPHPLGLNFIPGSPLVMLLQEAYWQPNLFYRTGTFHKQFNGRWISFGLETTTRVSAEKDEVYLEVQIQNRQAAPLEFTVIPKQSAPDLSLSIPGEKPVPANPVGQPDAFTLASNQVRITVVSDLSRHTAEGWTWEIPGAQRATARFAIILQQAGHPAPNLYAPDIDRRMNKADAAMRDRLRWAAARLPHVSTGDAQLDEFYNRSILSVLDARWERENFVTRPFYSLGAWTSIVPWDTSFSSEMLAILDPAGLRTALETYFRAGLLKGSYISWNGTALHSYAQNPFAVMHILQDYLVQTGDLAFLDDPVDGASVYEWLKRAGTELVNRYKRTDGLLDFGKSSNYMLELRTDGYQHVVAATNGMAAEYFQQVADWGRARNDADAAQFEGWAAQIVKSLNEKSWNTQAGWFGNLYPDGSQQLVWSYHLFDILRAGFLLDTQRQRMISHIKEGTFLGPYGMYAISKADRVHWDREDVDWGGGQYAAMPLRISESLYRLGYSELGWDILKRCKRWVEGFPYWPHNLFTDRLANSDVEIPLEVHAGSGVQTILFGVFGLRPQVDGSLTVSPSYHRELGEAKMTGYHFRGHSYDVVMRPWGFEAYRDGKLEAQSSYEKLVEFPRP
jgi:hypothetical protein